MSALTADAPRSSGGAPGSGAGPPPEIELPRLQVDAATHCLAGIARLDSPHCDARPDPQDISVLVVHGISLPPGEFGGPHVEALFMGTLDCAAHPYFERLRELRVSAHLFLRRDGRLRQFVPFDQRAWHAGESVFEGRGRVNDFSIGIEVEGTDDRPYTEAQYAQLARVASALLLAYPLLSPARIVGHSDIAPGRKTDPGPHFDWPRLMHAVEYARL